MRWHRAAAVTFLVLLGGSGAPVALAQVSPTVTLQEPQIIPEPNSGAEPEEAGDRGGGLQLTILASVALGVGGAVGHLVRQSRRARSAP